MKALKNLTLPLVLLFVFILGLSPVHSDDLWMYLALGRKLFTDGGFGDTEPFLFTFPGFHWHVWHEWFSYVVYYSIYLVTGFRGLVVFRALLVTCAAALVWKAGSRFKFPTALILLIGAASFYFASARAFADRASFFSDMVTVGLLYLLTDPKFIDRSTRRKWFLPVLFVCWVQFHPGYLIGWAMIGLFYVVHFRDWNSADRRNWLIIFGLCVIAPVLNPIGLKGVMIPIATFLSPDWHIFREINSEWMPTLTAYFLSVGYKIFVVVFSAGALLITGWNAKRGDWFPFIAALLLCYLGISAVRFLSLSGFGLGVLVMTSLERRKFEWLSGRWPAIASFSVPIFCILISLSTDTLGLRFFFTQDPVADGVPVKAARLFDVLPPGNIFNEYDFGGLLAWELNGRMKFAAHGHLDKPSLVVQNYYRFSYNRKNWDEIINGGNVEYFFFRTKTLLDNPEAGWVHEIMSPRWHKIYEDSAAMIFQRVR